MQGILDALVRAELGLHVVVAQDALVWAEVAAVRAEQAAIEREGGHKGERGRFEQRGGGAGGCGGEGARAVEEEGAGEAHALR